MRASLLRRIRKSRIWTAKTATATATAVRKLTTPIPLSLSAALVESPWNVEVVVVGRSGEVRDGLSVWEAEIAEERRELAIELVTEAAVPVAESVADAEASESVDDMSKSKPSTVWNLGTGGERRARAPNGENIKKACSQRILQGIGAQSET